MYCCTAITGTRLKPKFNRFTGVRHLEGTSISLEKYYIDKLFKRTLRKIAAGSVIVHECLTSVF